MSALSFVRVLGIVVLQPRATFRVAGRFLGIAEPHQ